MKTNPTHKYLALLCFDSYSQVTVNTRECECLITKEEGYQVVSFRGTEVKRLIFGLGIIDVITDLRIIPWKDKDIGWFHSGFLSGGKATAVVLAGKLDKNKPTYLTGHSLGGAVGLACAVKLKQQGFNVVEWVGFGSPKAQIFTVKKYEFDCTNYRHRDDVVPLMPRWIGYKHGYPVIRTNSAESSSRPTWKDHSIGYYLSLEGYVR